MRTVRNLPLTQNQVAKLLHTTRKIVRNLESSGVLTPQLKKFKGLVRSLNRRMYFEEDISKLRMILTLNRMGLRLRIGCKFLDKVDFKSRDVVGQVVAAFKRAIKEGSNEQRKTEG